MKIIITLGSPAIGGGTNVILEHASKMKELGEDVYPEIVIDSVNMSEHINAISSGDYEKVCELLIKSLSNLKAAGAEVAAITANTEHIVWDMAKSYFPLPVISIIDATTGNISKTFIGKLKKLRFVYRPYNPYVFIKLKGFIYLT